MISAQSFSSIWCVSRTFSNFVVESREKILFVFASHVLCCCVDFSLSISLVYTFSLRRSHATKSVSSSKSSSRTGSSSTFSAHKRKMRSSRAASSSSRARSSSTFHFSTIIFPISAISSKNGDSTRCRCRPTVQFCSRPT